MVVNYGGDGGRLDMMVIVGDDGGVGSYSSE